MIVAIVLGFFFGLQLVLGTSVPVRVVESGSMCVPYDGACNGWSHPFAHTLHVGDIIIIQKVNPEDLNTNYPNSDIIVYENPTDPTSTPIVHRIVATTTKLTAQFTSKQKVMATAATSGQPLHLLKNTIPEHSGARDRAFLKTL